METYKINKSFFQNITPSQKEEMLSIFTLDENGDIVIPYEHKGYKRIENIESRIDNWLIQREEKQAEKERARRQTYTTELNTLRSEYPIEILINFKKGSYISDCEIHYPQKDIHCHVNTRMHFGKRYIELKHKKTKIAIAQENRPAIDRYGHRQESSFEISMNRTPLNAYAECSYHGLFNDLKIHISPQDWHTVIEEKVFFHSVIKDKDEKTVFISGRDYDNKAVLILLLKDEEFWSLAIMIMLIWFSDGMWSFSESYDRYIMRACERCNG